jgi:integrase
MADNRPNETALVAKESSNLAALKSAIALWADSTTNPSSSRRRDLLRDKQMAVSGFFNFIRKLLNEITPPDVKSWQAELEGKDLKPATVYARLSRVSSFYEWAMADPALGQMIKNNPVVLARPKAPRAYQTESTKSLSDDELRALLAVVRGKSEAGQISAKRDYALLVLYAVTGIRRNELISLRGGDLDFEADGIIIRFKVKGGDYVAREVRDLSAKTALEEYLSGCKRLHALSTDSPLWTRHDRAGRPGEALTSHAFAKNLKKYALAAGIGDIHIHQIRHTYARIVAEETGSMIETQEALGHRNLATTRVYVQRIALKRDKHSHQITKRISE